MKKLTSKQHIFSLTLLCTAVYLTSYLTRKNFAAVIAEFTVAEGVEKSAASVITVSLFVFYGIGQLISGRLGDSLPPRKIMTSGLLLTTAVNILMPFVGANTAVMAVLWGINGLAQAFLWPPMVKIMTARFPKEVYKDSVMKVSLGSAVGTMLIYGIAALFIKLFGSWRTVFYFSAICGAVITIVWAYGAKKLEDTAEKYGTEFPVEEAVQSSNDNHKKRTFNPFLSSPLIIIMLAIVFQGMLRDGVEQWMPSYLSECYGIETSGAILAGVILPIFTMLCIKAASFIYDRYLGNELVCAAVMFGVGAAAAALLLFFHGKSTAAAIILVALVCSAMHGVNLILICMIPPHYEKYGNVSFISGLINFCTYIGSALFTYGIADIAERLSWNVTILSWVIAALLGTLLCTAAIGSWSKFRK